MRIALISDIHGNLVALETVLAEIAADGIDRVVCLGDIAAGGAQPQAVVERLQALGYPVVMGNADALCLEPSRIRDNKGPWGLLAEIDRWSAAQLSPAALAYIRTFPATIELELGDGKTLLCYHGSPRSYDDPICATTPDDDLRQMLGGSTAALFAGGHTHIQLVRRYRDRIVLNPGSAGMSFDPDPSVTPCPPVPWAEFAVVEYEQGRLRIDLRRIPFDVDAVLEAGLGSGMPHASWWAEQWRRG